MIDNAFNPTMSLDGQWLTFTLRGRVPSIVIQNQESGDLIVIDSTRHTQHPDFSPDSRYIAYVGDMSQDESEEAEYRTVVRPLSGKGFFTVSDLLGRYPKWSPEGKYISISVAREGIFHFHEATLGLKTSRPLSVTGAPTAFQGLSAGKLGTIAPVDVN